MNRIATWLNTGDNAFAILAIIVVVGSILAMGAVVQAPQYLN